VATVLAAAGVGVAMAAGPAAAHVEVSADKAQAGATNVTLTFVGEAESSSAGIASERVVLPKGMAPAEATLAKAPAGWKLTTNPDGFTIAGKALPIGKDATVAVKVAQLPADATRLSFKTIETYGDGKVSRWIEIQQEGAPEPDSPAPLLKLRPAAAVASLAPSSAAPSAAPSSAVPASASAEPITGSPSPALVASTGGGNRGWIVALVVVVLAALAAAAVVVLRRRGAA
jgi:hypothetical protein